MTGQSSPDKNTDLWQNNQTQVTQNRPDDKSPIIHQFLPYIWVKLVGYISDRVFVAPIDIGSTLFIDMQLYVIYSLI